MRLPAGTTLPPAAVLDTEYLIMALETRQVSPQRVTFLLDNLKGGGAERVVLDTASGFAALGYHVDLLVCELEGELCGSVPDDVNLVVLEPVGKLAGLICAIRHAGWKGLGGILYWFASTGKISRSYRYIPAIESYLRKQQPAVLSTALPKSGITAVLGASAARAPTRVFVGIQNAVSRRSEYSRTSGKGQANGMLPMSRFCFNKAHGIVASSIGVAEDAIAALDLDAARMQVVYNPVVVAPAREILERPDHPWFATGAPPVVLGIGRLVAQKNFPLLIRAFAEVRQQTHARLVILGGDELSNDQVTHRRELLKLIDELGLNEDVALIGFQSNPHVYLRTARVFVLSSLFEGFGNVVVEALLAGCPVVSTDCPSGPAEILEQGRYGILVPMEDPHALAQAILESLGTEHDQEKLRERGAEFSLERAVAGYHRAFFGEFPASSGAASADGASVKPTS